MLIKTHTLALAVAGLLAGCGGGSASDSSPRADAAGPRAQALAVGVASTVAPDESARQLLDYAEGAFKAYLPEHQATLSTGPARYRVYSSGTVLGVAVATGPYYAVNGVYVMGGAFGPTPRLVGLLTDFITPVEPGTGTNGPGNGCHDLDLAGTQGTQFAVDYEYSGPITGTKTVRTQVTGAASFEGQASIETIVKTTGVLFVDGLPTSATAEIRNYHRRTAAAEITHLGSTVATTAITTDYTAATTVKTVYAPAWVDRLGALAEGQTLTAAWTSDITRSTTYSIPGFPPTLNTYKDKRTETVRYVGRETISLPTGNYSTCRFEHINTVPGTGWTTEWVLAGNGLLLKSVTGLGNVEQSMRASAIAMNGNPL